MLALPGRVSDMVVQAGSLTMLPLLGRVLDPGNLTLLPLLGRVWDHPVSWWTRLVT